MKLCPKCSATINSVQIQDVDGTVAGRTRWACIAYTCPHCSHVLSVQIDPIALKTDILQGVATLLHQPH